MFAKAPPRNNKRAVLALCALTLLVGCGGGGGGSSSSESPAPPQPQPPPPVAPAMPFPRTSPAVTIPADDADYAARKRMFEMSAEYEVTYTVGTSENRVDSHLGRINAAAAYARGATGEGETIAIFDTGILASHPEFSGAGKVIQPGISNAGADKRHGTAVSAAAAARRDAGLNMHGVAYDATIAFREIPLDTPDGTYRPINLTTFSEDAAFFAQLIDYATTHNAAIMNASFNENGAISTYDRAEVISEFADSAAVLAQANTDDADKKIIVWAAGNGGSQRTIDGEVAIHDSPEIYAGFGIYFPELQKNIIAVVALDQDGTIARYSNRCGIAKDFCIAAPGSGIISALARRLPNNQYSDDYGYSPFSGTSFAAPIVSGSLAVLRQFFRGQIGNTELVTRLLATANREDIYADSDIYGHGLVDLDAATAPVGAMMTGLSGDPNRRPLTGTRFALSGDAFGTALQAQLAEVEFAAFDELDAPFFFSAENWLTQAARNDGFKREQYDITLTPTSSFDGDTRRGTTLSLGFDHDEIQDARLSLADGWWLSYGDQAGRALGLYAHAPLRLGGSGKAMMNHFSDSLAFAAPYLSLVRDGPGIGWSGGGRFGFALMQGTPSFDGYHKPGGKRGLGAVLDMRLSRGLWLQAGAVREQESFLGVRLQGALGAAHGTTNFFGINGVWAVGDDVNVGVGDDLRNHKPWRILASAYLGRTRAQVNGGLVQEVGTLISSAFSIGAMRESLWRRDDWFGLRLSQPLRTERGHLKIRLASGRTRYGETVSDDHTMNLAPAGRHVQVEAVYHVPLAGGALQATLGAERHSQHDHSSDIHPTFRVKFERRF